ncbi:MAG TPA: hypothetical protein VLQ48_02375 [Chloroflexia bacterium]|nr:hypothetical protein [Chloroflexia bacterium]
MALDFNTHDTVAPSEEAPNSGAPELSSDDILAPTCMFWAMVIGLAILGGTVILWILENVSKIGS